MKFKFFFLLGLFLILMQKTHSYQESLEISDCVIIFYNGNIPGVAYMTIRQKEQQADCLRAVRLAEPAPESRVEMHDHVSDFSQGSEIKKMIQLSKIDIPTDGSPVRFEPGGKHLMLYYVPDAFKRCPTLSLILTFEKAGEKLVLFSIQPAGGAGKNSKNVSCCCE